MAIHATEFGSITIDGVTYPHDVVIRLSGEVVKRRKKLSKRHYGTSHTIAEEEIRFVHEPGCPLLILGSGQYGAAALSPEAARFLAEQGCAVQCLPTPEAIEAFNRAPGPHIGLFHVTC